MLSAGTARAAIVNEALDLLFASCSELFPAAPAAAPIPKPRQWPASLRDFYRLIMEVRDKADAQPRFRRYLSSIHNNWLACLSPEWSADGADRLTDATFHDLQSKGFDKDGWLSHTRGYRWWWAQEVHCAKKAAGLKGYAAKGAARGSNDPVTNPAKRPPPPTVTGNPAIDRLLEIRKRRRPDTVRTAKQGS
jgi:hypothetical protein